MHKIFLFLLAFMLVQPVWAADGEVAATIQVVNQLQISLERTGASFGCGADLQSLSSTPTQNQIQCQYQGILYYDVTLPAENLVHQESTQSTIIAYPGQSGGYGRLGFQYALPKTPKLGCSIIVDFVGNRVSELRIQPLYSNPWIHCINKGNGKDVQLVITSG